MRFEPLEEWERRRRGPSGRRLDFKDHRSGALVGIKPVARTDAGLIVWECLCDCGNTTLVRSNALSFRRIKSCGRGDCSSSRRRRRAR